MQKKSLPIIGAVVLLVVVGLMALVTGKIGASIEVAKSFAPARNIPDSQITPVTSAPATPLSGGYAYDDPIGPNGLHPYVPPFKSDDDVTGATPLNGSPAIRPSIMGAGPDTPAFTNEDIMEYHSRNNIHGIWGYPSSTQPSIVRIELLTDKAVRGRIPSYASNRPDDALMYYVRYRGDFVLPLPPQVGPAIPCEYAFEIFDAHTGNRIAHGVDPRPTDGGP